MRGPSESLFQGESYIEGLILGGVMLRGPSENHFSGGSQ